MHKKIFEEYPVPKAIATLALPTILGMLVNIIYNMADTFFVGQTQDKNQVEQSKKAVDYTESLFQSSDATYLEILTARQTLLSAQLTEVSDNVQRMQAVITLYQALGGGR